MRPWRLAIIVLLLTGAGVRAQQPAPAGMSLADAAARRFPQPIEVGALLKRQVLQPMESQPTLGWVRDVVRRMDGTIDVIVDYGGIFGYFGRPIAVPVDAMALLGQYIEVVDFSPAQLHGFRTFESSDATPVPRNEMIRVGLARPSH